MRIGGIIIILGSITIGLYLLTPMLGLAIQGYAEVTRQLAGQ